MPTFSNNHGYTHIILILLVVFAIGLISFLTIVNLASFEGLFGHLFPKSPSHASITKDFGVNISAAEFGSTGNVGVLGRDYIYPSDINEYNYFSQKGLKLLRIPFTWERIQPQALGPLSNVDLNGLKTILTTAQSTNTKVILDLHNFGRYYNTPMTTQDSAKLADVWQKIATQIKDYPALYGYELMNEPHDLSEGSAGWATIAQATTTAIRQVDQTHYVLIPGYSWQSARFWQDNNANLTINDPANKLLYAAHLYFDGDYSGTYAKSYDADGAISTMGVDRVKPFLDWLAQKNVMGIMTEYGIPGDDPRWLTVLDNFENTLVQNDHIVGGTYWSAGPWWGGYRLSAEPIGTFPSFKDQPQISILQKYPSNTTKPGYIFGTINSDPVNAVADQKAGIQLATLQLAWDQYQPGEVTFNQTYINSLKQKIQTFKSAGQQIILDFGVQYPPSWVLVYPNSHFVNQFGHTFQPSAPGSGENAVNAIFNQTMRDKQENYIKQVFVDLGTDFYAVRLGWGNYGETGYPNPNFQIDTNSYWAFDPIAQGKSAGLPPNMVVDPVVGWIPGTPSTNHTLAQQFIDWYLNNLKNYHDWQITTVTKYFSGKKAMLYPSWGVRPGQLLSAVNDDLKNSNLVPVENNGEIQRGFDFSRLIGGISNPQVIVYGTWVDSNPTFSNDTGIDQSSWSPIHYLSILAKNHPLNLAVWGENTGKGDLNAMNLSFSRMQQFGLIGLNWAFDSDLFSGQYASLNDYKNQIVQVSSSPVFTPQPSSTPTSTPISTPTPSSCPKGPIGDTNCDGKIDLFDYNIVITNFNQTGTNIPGDIDKSGKVDLFDYNILLTNFGK